LEALLEPWRSFEELWRSFEVLEAIWSLEVHKCWIGALWRYFPRRIKGTLILLVDVHSKKRKKQEESQCKKQIYRIKTCMNNACLHKGRKKERKKNKQAKQV
jgi:hypothetical protein